MRPFDWLRANSFWAWYERTYTLNVSLAFGLFLLQIIHLIWLFGAVVWAHLFGAPLFSLEGVWEALMVFVDYTEIPAILSISLVYINELRKRTNFMSLLFLFFINSQWLHIFWITDEFVVTVFNEPGSILPLPWAWLAISIDYFEVPVMIDTGKKFFSQLARGTIEQ